MFTPLDSYLTGQALSNGVLIIAANQAALMLALLGNNGMAKDYYKILGVNKNANKEDLKKAYRKMAHQYHPDKKGGDEIRFKEVNEAYQVLSNEAKRAQYDQFGTTFENAGSGAAGFGGGFGDFSRFWGDFASGKTGGFRTEHVGFDDIFGDVFEGFGMKRKKGTRRGKDISLDIEVTLEDVFRGVKKEIELKKFVLCETCKGMGNKPGTKMIECTACGGKGEVQHVQRSFFGEIRRIGICQQCGGEGRKPEENCKTCGGEGRIIGIDTISIQIPPGISDGEMLKLESRGERGIRSADPGDLYVKIHVKEHSQFKRDGDDILSREDVSFSQAVLGDTVEVSTLGDNVKLKISPGIESGKLVRLKEKGLPHLYGGGKGDHYVEIRINTPKRLSKKQKELIEKLREEEL